MTEKMKQRFAEHLAKAIETQSIDNSILYELKCAQNEQYKQEIAELREKITRRNKQIAYLRELLKNQNQIVLNPDKVRQAEQDADYVREILKGGQK